MVEVVSGQSLDAFFSERILGPLGHDRDELRPGRPGAAGRGLYAIRRAASGGNARLGRAALRAPEVLSGGGGLISTAADYHRFTQMLVGGGERDGVRLLGTRTLRYMATQPPTRAAPTWRPSRRPLYAETSFDGVGFGLGFAVVEDPVAQKVPPRPGEFTWGGLASTSFWVDPLERITALFFTQVIPSSTYPLRTQFRQLVYQALVD